MKRKRTAKADTPAQITIQAEAQRRGWILTPTDRRKCCHGYRAPNPSLPCEQCWSEAMAYQLARRCDRDYAKPAKMATAESAAKLSRQMKELRQKRDAKRVNDALSTNGRARIVQAATRGSQDPLRKPRVKRRVPETERSVWVARD